jgi:hypothetical protein
LIKLDWNACRRFTGTKVKSVHQKSDQAADTQTGTSCRLYWHSFCQTGSNFFQKIFVFISIKNPLVWPKYVQKYCLSNIITVVYPDKYSSFKCLLRDAVD